MMQPLLSTNAALAKHCRVMCVAAILPLRCCNTVQTVASASTCKSPTCWLSLAPKNRNCIVMTLPLLSLIAALAQHDRVMCIATILPLHCILFRHLLQLPPVKLLPVACCLHPKWNCTVMTLLLLLSNAALAQHSRAKPSATTFPLCCCNYTQIPVSGVPVDYFCLLFVILKSTELRGGLCIYKFEWLYVPFVWCWVGIVLCHFGFGCMLLNMGRCMGIPFWWGKQWWQCLGLCSVCLQDDWCR